MKRLLTICGILLAGLAVFGWLRGREQSLALVTKNLEAQEREWQSKVSMAKAEQQQFIITVPTEDCGMRLVEGCRESRDAARHGCWRAEGQQCSSSSS